MKKIKEGQTQVYIDGSIHKTKSNDGYVQPNQQLMDLIHEFKRSNKSDSQVVSIMVGMGINQETIQQGLSIYNTNMNEQKNNKGMKFTLTQLYEKINFSLDNLKYMSADSTRISYSANKAISVLEQSLDLFPGINITESKIKKLEERLKIAKENEETAIKEKKYEKAAEYRDNYIELENEIQLENQKTNLDLTSDELTQAFNESDNPTLKFKITRNLYNNLGEFEYLNPIKELKSYLDDSYLNNKWSFKIIEAIDSLATRSNPLHSKLQESLIEVLQSDDVKESFKNITKKNPWSQECNKILNEIKIEENELINQKGADVYRLLTPVIETGNGYYFHLNEKDYFFEDSNIKEAKVTDGRYHNMLDCLSFASIDENTITFYGQDDKYLEYNIKEGKLILGEMNLSESDSSDIRDAILTNRLFHISESNKADKIALFFENVNMLTEMDNFLNVSSNKFTDLFLTLISVEEGVWVNKVNKGMGINEMVFYNSAQEVVSESINFIGYDTSKYLSEKLITEGNKKAIIKEKRSKINKQLEELEEKKSEVSNTIKEYGEKPELLKALSMVESNLNILEKKLQETYTFENKKLDKLSQSQIDDFADDGYVEARLIKTVDSNFKKGQEIMVNAEEYAAFGSGDLLKIINPNTGQQKLIDKEDLKVDL